MLSLSSHRHLYRSVLLLIRAAGGNVAFVFHLSDFVADDRKESRDRHFLLIPQNAWCTESPFFLVVKFRGGEVCILFYDGHRLNTQPTMIMWNAMQCFCMILFLLHTHFDKMAQWGMREFLTKDHAKCSDEALCGVGVCSKVLQHGHIIQSRGREGVVCKHVEKELRKEKRPHFTVNSFINCSSFNLKKDDGELENDQNDWIHSLLCCRLMIFTIWKWTKWHFLL